MTSQADRVREAQRMILDAVEELRAISEETDDVAHRRGCVASLEIAATKNHWWLARDDNLDNWIEELELSDEERDELHR